MQKIIGGGGPLSNNNMESEDGFYGDEIDSIATRSNISRPTNIGEGVYSMQDSLEN